MHGINSRDGDLVIDWGRTSGDYAAYRPGYPPTFFERLVALGVGRTGQRILDLGTGTGNLARELSRRGASVTGVDVSAEQVEQARALAAAAGLAVAFKVAPAEQTGLAGASFDAISASQSWLYFDKPRVIPEVKRLLAAEGVLVTCHISWLPRLDPIARQMEELVLRFNPAWSAGDWPGTIPAVPAWSERDFEVQAMFWYDEPLPFTRETWRGRIRACRGVGATLTASEVAAFDQAYAALLAETVPERFTVLHRIDAHVFRPRRDDGPA